MIKVNSVEEVDAIFARLKLDDAARLIAKDYVEESKRIKDSYEFRKLNAKEQAVIINQAMSSLSGLLNTHWNCCAEHGEKAAAFQFVIPILAEFMAILVTEQALNEAGYTIGSHEHSSSKIN